MNILALSYLFPNRTQPSYGIFVFNRLKAVSRHCELTVIAPLQWLPGLREKKDVDLSSTYHSLKVYYPRFLAIPRFLKWLDFVFYFLSVLPVVGYLRFGKKIRFDLVDVHWTCPDLLAGWLLARFLGTKCCVTIRGKEALCLQERNLRKKLLDWLLRHTDQHVCLSTELQQDLLDIGVPASRIQVILNGVDSDQFSFRDQISARNQLGLPQDKKIIISVGSLIARKGHHHLIRQLPRLAQNHSIELYIIGGVNPEGNCKAELEGLVAELSLDNVFFVNDLSHAELVHWYCAADLFCLATSGEGCPNVVMEALACGCPSIVSAVGAVPDLITDKLNGFIVPLEGDWHYYIDEALKTDWDRQKISSQMEGRNWAACAQQVVNMYQKLLEAERVLP